MKEYLEKGKNLALSMNNRGPIRRQTNGMLHPNILDAFNEYGFYIFENVLDKEELNDIRSDTADMIERAPAEPGSVVDKKGRPALGREFAREAYSYIKPLSDPWGVTNLLNGRHPSNEAKPGIRYYSDIIAPIAESIDGFTRQNYIVLAGEYQGSERVTSAGDFYGHFR